MVAGVVPEVGADGVPPLAPARYADSVLLIVYSGLEKVISATEINRPSAGVVTASTANVGVDADSPVALRVTDNFAAMSESVVVDLPSEKHFFAIAEVMNAFMEPLFKVTPSALKCGVPCMEMRSSYVPELLLPPELPPLLPPEL